jgi:membrane associated rhomboid family serine protease
MQHYEIKRAKASLEPITPIVTILLLVLCFVGFTMSIGQPASWLTKQAFSIARFDSYFNQGDFFSLGQMMFWATFTPLSVWQLLIGAYFLWVFGSTTEERLGSMRFFLIVFLCWLAGWVFLSFDSGVSRETLFISPSLLTAGLIGGYLIFFPEKKMQAAVPMHKYTYRIFKQEASQDPRELYGINPWLVLGAFVAFQIGMQIYMHGISLLELDLKGAWTNFDLMRPLAAMGAFLVGFAVSLTVVVGATKTVEGNPLKSLAWMKYRQLRKLDMSHDQAVKGAARLLAIPEEQARDWIGSGLGGPPEDKQ